jgi:hypothetical protein
MYIGVRLGINVITPWLTFTPKLNAFIIVMAGTSLGTIIYGIIISVFRLEETQLVLALFKNRLPGIRFRV